MKVLYLYAEVMGYTMSTINRLGSLGAEVHVVHWDHRRLTPYKISRQKSSYFYPRSSQTLESLSQLVDSVNPDITVVSGWQDLLYLKVARKLRKSGRLVVCGFDDQWHGSLRQQLALLLGTGGFFRLFYSHAWVTGLYQYEYARKLGFSRRDIIYDLYSADTQLFHEAYANRTSEITQAYPHRFLFVGRLEPVKGIDILIKSWQELRTSRRDWDLCLIGNGSMKSYLSSIEDVVVKDFMQPNELIHETSRAGCFVLPSRWEPWGVVIHEFAAMGLPLIASDSVGSAGSFLIPGLNGYSFMANNPSSLSRTMQKIIDTPDQNLLDMSKASYALSSRITPTSSAMNLLSIL